MNRLFDNTGITYKIIDNIIYLKKEKPTIKNRYTNSTEAAYQQRKREEPVAPTLYTFNGQVQDVEGNPLIGATIMVKGSSKVRAMSDLEGKFVLKSEMPNPILVNILHWF